MKAFRSGRFVTLQSLDLGACGIYAWSLAKDFCHMPALRSLHLTENGIEDGEAQSLAVAFCHIPALQRLELGGNQVGDDGAQSLVSATFLPSRV